MQTRDEALQVLRQAVAEGDARAEATALNNMAILALANGDSDAFDLFEHATAAVRRVANARNESVLLLNFVPALLKKGDLAPALEHARRAVELTERAAIEHRVLARLHLGIVWWKGFHDSDAAAGALADALIALDEHARRKPERSAEMRKHLETVLAEAAHAALEAGHADLAKRLATLIDPSLASRLPPRPDPTSGTVSLELPSMLALEAPEFDELLARWRRRHDTSPAPPDPAMAEPVLAAQAQFGWDDKKAADATASVQRDASHPTRGGPAAILLLAELLGRGRIGVPEATEAAATCGVGDDDLCFLLVVPGLRDARYLPGLLDLVARVARDVQLAARCARLAAYCYRRSGKPAKASDILLIAERRLPAGVDDALRADLLIRLSEWRLERHEFDLALKLATDARELADQVGDVELSLRAEGTQINARRNDGPQRQLQAYEALASRQRAAHDLEGLRATEENMVAVLNALGQIDTAVFEEPAFDPDRWFNAAQALALRADRHEAIERYREGLRRLSGQPAYWREPQAHANLARLLFDARDLAGCRAEMLTALRQFEELGDVDEQIRALQYLASPDVSPQTAGIAHAERAVKLARQHGRSTLLATSLLHLGQLCIDTDRVDRALAAFGESLAIERRPLAEFSLAYANVAAGRPEQALAPYARLIEEQRSAGGTELVRLLVARAQAFQALRRHDEAGADLHEARQLASGVELGPELGNALGWAEVESGATDAGIALLETALASARAAGRSGHERAIASNLGMAYAAIGEHDAAEAMFAAARQIARSSGSAPDEAPALLGLADVAKARHDDARAEALYLEAAGLARQHGLVKAEAHALDLLAHLRVSHGAFAAAADLQCRAIDLHQGATAWKDEAIDRINLATTYFQLRENDRAAAQIEAARALIDAHDLGDLASMLAGVRARLKARLNDWRTAREIYREGFRQRRDALRNESPSEHRRRSLRYQALFGQAVEDALLANDAASAIGFIEAGRGRYYDAVITQRRQQLASASPAIVQRWEVVLDQIDRLQRRRRVGAMREDTVLREQLAVSLATRDSLARLLPPAPPAPDAGLEDFATLARAIPPGHAVVYLGLGNPDTLITCAGRDERGVAWSVGMVSDRLRREHVAEILYGDTGILQALRGSHAEQLQPALAHCAQVLGALLWPEIGGLLGGRTRRLILSPGAGFNMLPLHAARLDDHATAQDRWELRYAPSLRLLDRASRSDPISRSATLGQAIDPNGDLPFAAAEAALAAGHMSGSRISARSESEATPDAALSLFVDTELVHFCGHGSFEPLDPLQSRLHCAPDPAGTGSELSVRRVIDLADIRCRLAILSSCESGRTEDADELDDAIGLPGALLAAGCRGVLATMWRVDDLAACLFVDEAMARWMGGDLPWSGAIAHAARWLRRADRAELDARLDEWCARGIDEPTIELGRERLRQVPAANRPFADSVHWAAFYLTGFPDAP
ncbi:CHAT domain-containing tetratricopeptide repeat protein [Variovorax saccharolyticus]|uniref:CHAT domain-containing tetratricopeptide repeat protein n=1 Tax=Variovorax saccharolyticus TaxID=3053516 RepID=UPI0025773D9B|nr:CHAT domain-containing protein [Variovorax sp. J22R187]MDM0022162.1 CHAT domain-containing protein [Variovorax sp. J22R187]